MLWDLQSSTFLGICISFTDPYFGWKGDTSAIRWVKFFLFFLDCGQALVADRTGIVVVPQENAQDILAKAKEAEKSGAHFTEELRKGKTFGEMQKQTGQL